MSDLERSKQARFFECSWVGQFRAIDADKARLFAQAVANKMQEMGVNDVGYDARIMPREYFQDPPSVGFAEDVMGASPSPPHPWDEGLSLFPEDHPLRAFEDLVRDRNDPNERRIFQETAKRLELESGDEGE